MLRRRKVVPVAYFPGENPPVGAPRRPLRALERRKEPMSIVLPANYDVEMQEHPDNQQTQSSASSAQHLGMDAHSAVIHSPIQLSYSHASTCTDFGQAENEQHRLVVAELKKQIEMLQETVRNLNAKLGPEDLTVHFPQYENVLLSSASANNTNETDSDGTLNKENDIPNGGTRLLTDFGFSISHQYVLNVRDDIYFNFSL